MWLCFFAWQKELCKCGYGYGPYDGVIILDYTGGTSVITHVLWSGRERQNRDETAEKKVTEKCKIVGFKDSWRRPKNSGVL